MIERAVVDQVRGRVDIVELVGQYVPLRRAGSNYVARCPFHDEKTPSFSVSADKGFYFCFGCKAQGDVFTFFMQMEGADFPEALRVLAERAGVALPETRDPARIAEDRRQRDVTERLLAVCEAATVYFEECLRDAPFSELARGALDERGVTAEIAQQFRLGYAPAQWDGLATHLRNRGFSPSDAELAGLLMPGRAGGQYDRFRHRLMFPVFDRGGRVVAFSGRMLPASEEIPEGIIPAETGKYINSPETPIYRKGELLYGLANARIAMRQRAEAILVEGNFDVVQMHQHGFHETVAPLGTSFTDAQAKLLRRFAETVVIVFDGDDAGRKAARTAHPVCARAGLIARVGLLPLRLDPDTYLRSDDPKFGPDGMRLVLKDGMSIVDWLIRDASLGKDHVPDRVAALRLLMPTLAAVRDRLEQELYIKSAANAFRFEEQQVQRELRTYMRDAEREQRAVPFERDDARQRPGLSAPKVSNDVEGQPSPRKVLAVAVEAMLMRPDLLGSDDARALAALDLGGFAPVVERAMAQWEGAQRLDGPALLETCPTDEAKAWVASRLMTVDESDQGLMDRCAATLADSVRTLQRLKTMDHTRTLKHESARSGTQGDPLGELDTLNTQLQVKRELARTRR